MEVVFHGRAHVSIDIVFVHGLRGDKRETWSHGNVFWPKDLLPKDLPFARIMTWGYNAEVVNFNCEPSQNSIAGFSGDLLSDLSSLRLSEEEV